MAIENKSRKQDGAAGPGSAESQADRQESSPQVSFSQANISRAELTPSPELEDFYQKLQPEMRRPKPGPAEMAAALEAVQRLAIEAGAEEAASDLARKITVPDSAACAVCGYNNRDGNRFCAMCGQPLAAEALEPQTAPMDRDEGGREAPGRPLSDRRALSATEPKPFAMPRAMQSESTQSAQRQQSTGGETHHYHHHYHHHYFPGGQPGIGAPGMIPRAVDPVRDPERLRPSSMLRGESLSRAEAAVRRVTQDWILACNTKHLDNLLDVYAADALVLRSNYPAVRGAAAVREFFFNALNSGLGEVELEPMRVDVSGDIAYEAGRCKALVPGANGKRREERGKYLWVFARQGDGEWKLIADCWSSDLTLSTTENDAAATGAPASRKPA